MKNATAKLNRSGNIKLGNMATFSKLYGNDTFRTPYGLMRGTCGGYCIGCKIKCYVGKSYRYPSVIKCHARNTAAFRDDIIKAFADINNQIDRMRIKPSFVRINQSGEIESAAELKGWIYTAVTHKHIKFYVYTKAFDILDAVLATDAIPDNLTVLISVWHEYGVDEFKKHQGNPQIKAFVYMDGYDYSKHGLTINTVCRAYDSNGKLNHDITCDKCRKCIDMPFKVIGCNEH